MNAIFDHQVIHWNRESNIPLKLNLVKEEPLAIRIQDVPYSVVMRTPGDEIPHVAGLCFSKGIVDTPDDFISLKFCNKAGADVVTATLTQSKRNKIPNPSKGQSFISHSHTDCSIYTKERETKIDIKKAFYLLENLFHYQPLHHKTRASHAAALYSSDFKLLSVAEDVGRHNALDKAIGRLFLDRRLYTATILVLSSRISHELVQKAARAGIQIILAISRPTSIAVELATKLNITLASLAKESGLYIFCGKDRLL